MKKRKLFLFYLIFNISLFSCAKKGNSHLKLDDEVESIIVDSKTNLVAVGQQVNIENYIKYSNDVNVSFTVEVTKNSLERALVSDTNNHIVEFVNEGDVYIKVTTSDNKEATLKFKVLSNLKSKFLNYISDANKNYAFLKYSEDESTSTYSWNYQIIHHDDYMIYDSSTSLANKNYSGYLNNKLDNKTYKFETDNLKGDNLDVLYDDTGVDFSRYLFSQSYSIDEKYLSTKENNNTQYLYIDLSNDISLATSYLTGPMMLLNQRKSVSDFGLEVIQGDHIIITFEDVEYKDFDGNTVSKNLPVYQVYYSRYYEGYSFKTTLSGGTYALLIDDGSLKCDGVENYLESKAKPVKYENPLFRNILADVNKIKNYELTISGMWTDDYGYSISTDRIPTVNGKYLFDNYQSTSEITSSKIRDTIIYGYDNSSIKPTYVYEKIDGDSKFKGEYKEDDKTYLMEFYYDKNDSSYKLDLTNKTDSITSSQKVTKEKIDDSSFYISFNVDNSKVNKYKFVTSEYKDEYDVYLDDNKLVTLTYSGRGIKKSSNVNKDSTLADSLTSRGFILNGDEIDTSIDLLTYKDPLNDLTTNFTSEIDVQKIADITTTKNNKEVRIVDVLFSKVDTMIPIFKTLLNYYPETGNSLVKYMTQTNRNIYGEEFTYISLFDIEVQAYYENKDNNIPTNILLDYSFTYSSTESLNYHIVFTFSNFNQVTL